MMNLKHKATLCFKPRMLASAGLVAITVFAAGLKTAQAADQENAGLTEIVVTAEKSNRSLRETAASTTVFDERTLNSRAGLTDIDEVLGRLPNVVDTGGGLAPAVRGLDGTGPTSGGTAFFAGSRARINIRLDGRPLSYNEAAYGTSGIFDTKQIEMLRGPQSTLQGRNAIAGTMAITTNNPTYDFAFGGKLVTGSDDFKQGAAYISGPIVEDQVAFRLSADLQERDSFVEMQPDVHDAHPEEIWSRNLRGKLLIEPKAWEGVRNLVTVNHVHSKSPQVELLRAPYSDHVSGSIPYFGSSEPSIETGATAAVMTTEIPLSGNVDIENTISFTDFTFTRRVLEFTGNAQLDGREWVLEPRIRVKLADDRINWLSGLFYFNSSQSEFIDVGNADYRDRTKTFAVFSEAQADLNEWHITLGGRYERENRRRFTVGGFFPVDLDETIDVFLPKFGLAYDVTPEVRVGAVVSRGYNGGGAGVTLFPTTFTYVYSPEFVWNYEAYLRAELNSRVSINLNAFYSDYEGMQVNFDNGTGFYVTNVRDVKVYGLEGGLRYAPLPGLELSAEFGLMGNKINDATTILDGQKLARTPKASATFSATYRSSGFEASVDARYSGRYYSRTINLADEVVTPYWVVNAQIGYQLIDQVRVFGYVTNMLNTGAAQYYYAGFAPEPLAQITRPRTINAGVSFSF